MVIVSADTKVSKATNSEPLEDALLNRRITDTAQLSLTLGCNAVGKTVVQHRYMAYPLSVSPVFRLDGEGDALARRAYLYRMNTSPGLLAGDRLSMSVRLDAGSALCLSDQAATKVHTMTRADKENAAEVRYDIAVGENATLEFLPEPLILFADSALKQTTDITLHETGGLSWGEIVLPGRLARGELYQFREYWSKLRLFSPDGSPCLVEAMKLLGKGNRFSPRSLFAKGPVLGTLILVLPETSRDGVTLLSKQIDALSTDSLQVASSVLPNERGVFVRAIATTTREMQASFKAAANYVRTLRHQPSLPYSL
ncbi:MAG: urease accessory protein UreD [Cyanobacteria bacterium J06621_3]